MRPTRRPRELRAAGTSMYACDCSRTTFEAWRAANGVPWIGPAARAAAARAGWISTASSPAPGRMARRGCARHLAAVMRRGRTCSLGQRAGPVAPSGDLLVRDRSANWTYGLCVVVDDLRHGIDLVVRGEDLVESTPTQIRLGQLLGRRSRRPSPITRSCAARTAPSSARPKARRRSASFSTRADQPKTSSERRHSGSACCLLRVPSRSRRRSG